MTSTPRETPRCRLCRHLRAAAAGAAISFAALVALPVVAQSPAIEVTAGAAATVPDTYASGTYSSITVSGTDSSGERSTLTVNESLDLDEYQAFTVTAGGLLVVNANVTGLPYAFGQVDEGGTLNLLSGTLTTGQLSLSGSSAFQRTGGSYAVSGLSLANGAVATFGPDDMLTGGYHGVAIGSGATLELHANLAGGDGVDLWLAGAGSRIVRSTGTETITGAVAISDGANFDLSADDTIVAVFAGDLNGTDPVVPSVLTLAPGTTRLNVLSLGLGRGGTIAGLESVPFTTRDAFVAGQTLEYRPSDSITSYVGIFSSGTVSLQQNLSLSGEYSQLSMTGSASTLDRNGFTVSTPNLRLADGASLTIGDAITVSRGLDLDAYAGDPTSVTLAQSLVLSESDGVRPSIFLNGAHAGIVRAPGLTITAAGASLMVTSSGSFAMQAGDDFTGATVGVFDGSTMTNAGPQSLASVYVQGLNYETLSPATYTAAGPLVIGGTDPGQPSLSVGDGGRFEAAADVTVDRADVYAGQLAVLAGTFTVSEILGVSGNGSVSVDPGGTLHVGIGGTTGELTTDLDIGGTLAFDRSDTWIHAFTISGSGSVTKLGAGVLTLAAANSYSGGTQILAGTLRAENGSSFGTGTIFLSSGATLDLADLTVTNAIVNNGGTILNGAGYNGTQAVSSGTATITGTSAGTVIVDTPGATAQIAGTVTGTITASNGGTVIITGSVSSTAQVTVGAGSTVTVGNGAVVAQPTLANAGLFAVANTTGQVILPTAITGTGSFEKTGAGSVLLTGSSEFTGGSTINSGEVVVQNTKALGTGGVTIGSGGRLLVDGVQLDLGGAAVALITGAELQTTSGAQVAISGSSDLSGVRSTSPAAASAAILAGTAVTGTLATTWTTSADTAVKSEVLQLTTPTTAANPFVLSLSYAAGLDPAGLFLGWNDPTSGAWVNAVAGNTLLAGMTAASGGQLGYLGSFATFQGTYGTNLTSYLGAYGRDDIGLTVWAVVNHNSEFAVTQSFPVPEPGAWAMAIVGFMTASLMRRSHTRGRRNACSASGMSRPARTPCKRMTRGFQRSSAA